jgi:hypothetical protein
MEELLDDLGENEILNSSLKKEKKILFIVLAVLTLINFLIAPFGFDRVPMFGVNGERLVGALTIGVAIWGFILGLLIALAPYKNLIYKQKYFTAALLGMCIVQILMTAGIFITIVV